jgi:hypothetical protein
MAIDLLNNCYFDSTRISKLYMEIPEYPLEYKTMTGSTDYTFTVDSLGVVENVVVC